MHHIKRIRPGSMLAFVALFVALAGTATAAHVITATRLANIDYNTSALISNPTGSQSFGSVSCDPGRRAVGGGVFGSGGIRQSVNSSNPSGTTGWAAYMNNATGSNSTFRVYVICVSAASVSKAKDAVQLNKE